MICGQILNTEWEKNRPRNYKGRHHCSTPLPIRERQAKATISSSSVKGRLEAKSGEDALCCYGRMMPFLGMAVGKCAHSYEIQRFHFCLSQASSRVNAPKIEPGDPAAWRSPPENTDSCSHNSWMQCLLGLQPQQPWKGFLIPRPWLSE